ncbi:MAG: hypothetical protein NT067_06495, partial [Candidatus Diapherotrites archaeon]|nr:hypothetical protein [Candidatus Diapherotrites archaeon]
LNFFDIFLCRNEPSKAATKSGMESTKAPLRMSITEKAMSGNEAKITAINEPPDIQNMPVTPCLKAGITASMNPPDAKNIPVTHIYNLMYHILLDFLVSGGKKWKNRT